MARPLKKPGRKSSNAAQPRRATKRRRPGKRTPRTNDQPGERLQKILASAGLASRREAEELILEGRVEVDGEVVTELGTRVDVDNQTIHVDGESLPSPKRIYLAVNKPTGVVCTARDPSGRPRVLDMLPPDTGRVFTVGRLDMESEGLILVTNDGELANKLTHPKHGVEKTYEVQVAGRPDVEVLGKLRKGMYLAEGYAHPVNVRIKGHRKNSTILEMVLDEGRNREIRRLLARVGHKVQRLSRIAVGPVRLGEMPRGSVRKLTPEEVRKLRDYASSSANRSGSSRPSSTRRGRGNRQSGSAAAKGSRRTGKRSPR